MFTPVPCASLNLSVSLINSWSSRSPSTLSEAGSAFEDTATIDEAIATTSDRCSFRTDGADEVRMAARRFWIELTSADDCVLRYGWGLARSLIS